MNSVILGITMLLTIPVSNEVSLEVVRKSYDRAATDKGICQDMIRQLEKHHESSVHLAYLGGFQAMWAKHTGNPIDKINTFNKGKSNIDKALKQVSGDIEIIFIRYSVQKNCPGFLGYNDNITEDRNTLQKNLNNISSATLKTMVEKLLEN